ncbi:MAG: hypothetical protein JJ895_06750 [Balneolaceae bacterium]|nr:hypothetical protein [Balneolaceae bacterium]
MNNLLKFLLVAILVTGTVCNTSSPEINTESLLPGRFTGKAGVSQNTGHYEEFIGTVNYLTLQSDSSFIFSFVSLTSQNDTSFIKLFIKSLDLPNESEYTIKEAEDKNKIFSDSFTGEYISSLAVDDRIYYSESGILTITEINDIGIKGTVDAEFYYIAPTGSETEVKVRTPLEIKFYAISAQ